MNTNSKWMPTTAVLVVMVLMATTILEPAAFGKDPEDTKPGEKAAEKASAPLPSRPEFMIAQAAVSQTQTRTVTPQAIRPPETPAPRRQSTSKSKKWIWIVVAAGAAGTAAFVARGGNGPDPGPAPTIVVGTPIVGQPQ